MNESKQLPILCENLHHLRVKHGLSETEMAHILGIGMKTLNSLECGRTTPRLGSSVLYNAVVYFNIKADVYFNIKADDLLHSRIE